jgi:hypothetical protein
MSALLTKWTPFDVACRLRSLQQGALNVGNTQQNITALYNLAVTQANGAATWAKWRGGNNVAQNHSNLLLNVPLVPGYTASPGTYGYGDSSLPLSVSMTAGASSAGLSFEGMTGSNWTGYISSAANDPFGSLSGSPNINGNVIVAIAEANGAAVEVVLQGVLAQTEFTEIAYTDTDGAQSFLTANASFSTGGGYSKWSWTSGVNGKFTNGQGYTITFS